MKQRVYHWPKVVAICEANEEHGATHEQFRDGTDMLRHHVSTMLCYYLKQQMLFAVGAPYRKRYFLTQEAAERARPWVEAQEAARTASKAPKPRVYVGRPKAWADKAASKTYRLIHEAGPAGLTTLAIAGLRNYHEKSVECHLTELRRDGLIFTAKSARWAVHFASEQYAKDYKAARDADRLEAARIKRQKRHEREVKAKLAKEGKAMRVVKHKPPKPKPVRVVKLAPAKSVVAGVPRLDAAQPVLIPSNVKITRIPAPVGRFEVTGPVVGGFATLGIGRYIEARP